ncbi:MAG: CvpA family protein [Leadbetterella sp.]|nr:CvpA family protein [Leadbetterella sp.]
MSAFDLFLLIPIAIGAFNGYRKGLLIEIFGIAAFVAAIIIGFKFLYLGAGIVEDFIGTDRLKWLSPYLSFFVVFLPSLFLIRQVGLLMKKAIRITFLGVLDGLLGAALGAVTAAFGVSIFIWIVEKVGIHFPDSTLEESKLYDFLKGFAPRIISLISDWLPGGNWIEYLEEVKEKFRHRN